MVTLAPTQPVSRESPETRFGEMVTELVLILQDRLSSEFRYIPVFGEDEGDITHRAIDLPP